MGKPAVSEPTPRTAPDPLVLLRLAEEPCRTFDELTVHRALCGNAPAFMDLLNRFYLAWGRDAVRVDQPTKQVFQHPWLRGDWRVMPCEIEGFAPLGSWPIKGVKVIGTNEESRVVPDKICVGKALLLHPTDNFVQAMFDVCALSSFRTAALAVVACRHAYRRPDRVGIIGAGRIGYYTAMLLREWMGVGRVSVFDPCADNLDRFAALIDGTMEVEPASVSSMQATCDALFLATTSGTPILRGAITPSVRFIAGVGADADNLSELDADVRTGRRLISESKQNMAFGDMARWHAAGRLSDGDIIELRHLVANPPATMEPTLFVSTGTAVQDVLACRFILDQADRSTDGVAPMGVTNAHAQTPAS
jgi:ornithine cyclodeaminase/alanine dehydrogenase-like protein (mu-crystallin family)